MFIYFQFKTSFIPTHSSLPLLISGFPISSFLSSLCPSHLTPPASVLLYLDLYMLWILLMVYWLYLNLLNNPVHLSPSVPHWNTCSCKQCTACPVASYALSAGWLLTRKLTSVDFLTYWKTVCNDELKSTLGVRNNFVESNHDKQPFGFVVQV